MKTDIIVEAREEILRLTKQLAACQQLVDAYADSPEPVYAKRKKSLDLLDEKHSFPSAKTQKKTRRLHGHACCGSKGARHKKDCAGRVSGKLGRVNEFKCIGCDKDFKSTLPFDDVKCPTDRTHQVIQL